MPPCNVNEVQTSIDIPEPRTAVAGETVVAWLLPSPDEVRVELARKAVGSALSENFGTGSYEVFPLGQDVVRVIGMINAEDAKRLGGVGLGAINALPRLEADRIPAEVSVAYIPQYS